MHILPIHDSAGEFTYGLLNSLSEFFVNEGLVAMYRAIRLRFGYGFELCDASGLRNVKNQNRAKQIAHFPDFSLLVVRNRF